jgi:hypothetical protein
MRVNIEIKADLEQAKAMLAGMSSKRFSRAMNTAVNDTGRQTLTFAARSVAKEAGLTAGATRRQFGLRRSTPATLTATVRATGFAIRLIEFKARQTRRGVTANAWGQRKLYPKSFIATMRSGHRQVFVRKGRARLPIKALWGPSVPGVMAQDAIHSAIESHAAERLQTNIGRQIDRALFAATGTR